MTYYISIYNILKFLESILEGDGGFLESILEV